MTIKGISLVILVKNEIVVLVYPSNFRKRIGAIKEKFVVEISPKLFSPGDYNKNTTMTSTDVLLKIYSQPRIGRAF
jgi:hypothetical protein